MITGGTIRLLIPEIVLVAAATWIYVAGAFTSNRDALGRFGWNLFALAALAISAGAMFRQDTSDGLFAVLQSGPLLVDYFGHAMRWLVVVVGALFVLLASQAGEDDLATEYLGSLLLVVAGLMITCTAGDLVLLFVGLELVSIPTYILLYLGRPNLASQESTTKYFFLSILSSALLLYGLSFLYGVGGSTSLVDLASVIASADFADSSLASLLPVAAVLVIAGLGFKIAAVPFHFYAPDVYQGTTAGNAGLLAVAPKIAGIVAIVRLLGPAAPGLENLGWQVVLILAALTMTLGNVLALWQQNVRRMMAYSSIAHAGYMLVGLAVGLAQVAGAELEQTTGGISAMLFYLVVYVLATTGTFAALAYLGARGRDIENVEELAGVGKTHPTIAAALAVFLFSLTGIPPLAGFFGKFTLFMGALNLGFPDDPGYRAWFLVLAILAAINAAISAGYYLRIIAAIYFRPPVNVPRAEGGHGAWLSAVVSTVLLIAATLLAGPLLSSTNRASRGAQLVESIPPQHVTAPRHVAAERR